MEALPPLRILLGVAVILILLYLILTYILTPKYDRREPPAVPTFLPYVGHIINLIRFGQQYFETLCITTPYPIFTLQTLHKRLYVLSSPSLILAAERASKTITFSPFVIAMSPRLFDVGPREMSYIALNADGTQGPWGLLPETTQGMHAAMAPGKELERMVKATLERFRGSLDDFEGREGERVGLFTWIRKEFAIASTDSIYGPSNPFAKDSRLEECFWDVEKDLVKLLLSPLPSITARKAFLARKKLTSAVREYVEDGGVENAGGVFRVRHDVARKYGATTEDIARYELGDLIGVLVNATPTLFWALLHIYSDAKLLLALRTEVEAMMTTAMSKGGKTTRIIDTTELQDSCPLLLSTFKEVLRYHTHYSTVRMVIADTILDDKFLLKKGSVVQMPGAPIHYDPTIWGSDAGTFNPHRFLPKETGVGGGNNKAPPAGAYRAWGGGATLCPGRFFATKEISSILAMMIVRFDIEPSGSGGQWVWPETQSGRIASSIHPPKGDVRVRVKAREGLVGDWKFGYAEGV